MRQADAVSRVQLSPELESDDDRPVPTGVVYVTTRHQVDNLNRQRAQKSHLRVDLRALLCAVLSKPQKRSLSSLQSRRQALKIQSRGQLAVGFQSFGVEHARLDRGLKF